MIILNLKFLGEKMKHRNIIKFTSHNLEIKILIICKIFKTFKGKIIKTLMLSVLLKVHKELKI